MIYFTAHTFKCVCHCRRAMFRVLGMYNFDGYIKTKNFPPKRKLGSSKAKIVNKMKLNFDYHPKLYTPSTLNIDLVLWHT